MTSGEDFVSFQRVMCEEKHRIENIERKKERKKENQKMRKDMVMLTFQPHLC